MVIIHAVKKLLNTSRISAALHIGKPTDGQHMYSWYATVIATGFAGKMLVMYVHEPSMMAVICRGKTIQTTWPQFRERVAALLHRFEFPEHIITNELREMNGYTVSKTDSRSMLAIINQLKEDVAWYIEQSDIPYAFFPLEVWEDRMMKRLHAAGRKPNDYTTPIDYWRKLCFNQ